MPLYRISTPFARAMFSLKYLLTELTVHGILPRERGEKMVL
jgi:hypothetical protein